MVEHGIADKPSAQRDSNCGDEQSAEQQPAAHVHPAVGPLSPTSIPDLYARPLSPMAVEPDDEFLLSCQLPRDLF